MEEAQEKLPYYSIFIDLTNHPYLAENQELALFLADFLYQLGYRKPLDRSVGTERQRKRIVDIIREWATSKLAKWHKSSLDIEELVDQIIPLIEPLDRPELRNMSWLLAEIYGKGKSGASINYRDYTRQILALFPEGEPPLLSGCICGGYDFEPFESYGNMVHCYECDAYNRGKRDQRQSDIKWRKGES